MIIDDWISVKDELPEDNNIVNICGGDVLDSYGMKSTSGWWHSEYKSFEGITEDKDYELMSASHWQPLPQPPKGFDNA